MQFLLDEQQIEVKENAERLLKENLDNQKLIEQVSSDLRLDRDLWKLIADQGWLALDISEEEAETLMRLLHNQVELVLRSYWRQP